jgi:hypothetical protein
VANLDNNLMVPNDDKLYPESMCLRLSPQAMFAQELATWTKMQILALIAIAE